MMQLLINGKLKLKKSNFQELVSLINGIYCLYPCFIYYRCKTSLTGKERQLLNESLNKVILSATHITHLFILSGLWMYFFFFLGIYYYWQMRKLCEDVRGSFSSKRREEKKKKKEKEKQQRIYIDFNLNIAIQGTVAKVRSSCNIEELYKLYSIVQQSGISNVQSSCTQSVKLKEKL